MHMEIVLIAEAATKKQATNERHLLWLYPYYR